MESKNLPVYFENLSINLETERRNVNVSDSNPSSSDDTALTSKLQTHLIRLSIYFKISNNLEIGQIFPRCVRKSLRAPNKLFRAYFSSF